MTAPHVSTLRSPLFINKAAAVREFDDERFLYDAIVQALKPDNPIENSHGYFARLSSSCMQNVVDDMEFSRLPESAWVLMQNLGVCNEEYSQCLHLVLYQGPPIVDFNRSNWRITPRTLELLNLAYKRGKAHESFAAIRREAIRAYLSDGLYAMADVLKPVPGLLAQAVNAMTLNEEKHYDS